MSRYSVEAHALGVLADAEESGPREWDRERLIERHKSHVARIHAGITQRAMQHREEVSGLEKQVHQLRAEERVLSRRVTHLMLALLFCVGAVLYFAVKDVGCPSLPWIVKVAQ